MSLDEYLSNERLTDMKIFDVAAERFKVLEAQRCIARDSISRRHAVDDMLRLSVLGETGMNSSLRLVLDRGL